MKHRSGDKHSLIDLECAVGQTRASPFGDGVKSDVPGGGASLPRKAASQFGTESGAAFQGMLTFLSEKDREQFFHACKEQRFQAGTHLFSQGTRYTATFVMKKGLVRTYYVSPGGEEITIAYWSDGALVGGPSVFNEESVHIWSAQAVEDTVTLAIRGRDLEKLVQQNPAVAIALVNALSFKLHWTSVLLQGFGTDSVRGRLAHLLLQLSEHYGVPCGDGVRVKFLFSHEELGRMVGASRPWVTRTVNALKREGVLGVEGRHLVIRNRDALRQLTFHPD